MPSYGDPEYWEKRYEDQQGRTFDWLEKYETIKPLMSSLLTYESKILILGCGNAELGENLYEDNYKNIDNIDISATVISQMKQRNIQRPEMTWTVMDVRDLKFESNTYDLAIDKSTIDALLCGDNSYTNVAIMTKEVQRVLKPGGTYVVITYGAPDNRLDHFQWKHLHWEVSHQTLNEGTNNLHYIYYCKKKQNADEICAENWAEVEEALREEDQEDLHTEEDEVV
jgi:EEF1A lysine methyltransferase 4